MVKKIFAASAIVASAICGLFGANASAASEAVTIGGGAWNICVSTSGSYSGSNFVANINGDGFESQLVFDDFENEGCKSVKLPAGSYSVSVDAPMGIGSVTENITGNSLKIQIGDRVNKYLNSYGVVRHSVVSENASVFFDANGGSGVMEAMEGLVLNTDYTLPSNVFTKNNSTFSGWNTKSDGTGVSYADGAAINVANSGGITLYAQWQSEGVSVLKRGTDVRAALASLAGGAENIHSINFTDDISHLSNEVKANKILISLDGYVPTYAYYSDGAVFIMSEAADGVVIFNKDSSHMFEDFSNFESIEIADYVDISDVSDISRIFYGVNIEDATIFDEWNIGDNVSIDDAFYRDGGMYYPEWYLARKAAYLETGDVINSKIRALVGNCSYSCSFGVLQFTELPDNFVATSDNTISVAGSKEPVYIWADEVDGEKNYHYYTSGVAVVLNADSSKMFQGVGVTDIELKDEYFWETRYVVNMSYMFDHVYKLKSLAFAKRWIVSNVTDMSNMFVKAITTTSVDVNDIAGWDTGEVVDMRGLFASVFSLDFTPLNRWNVSKVQHMENAFDYSIAPSWYQGN